MPAHRAGGSGKWSSHGEINCEYRLLNIMGLPSRNSFAPYLLAASICTNLIDNGAPGWLYLVVLLCVWNALKFLWIGPVSLIHLVLIRTRERRTRLASWSA